MEFSIILDHDFHNVSMTVGVRKRMTTSPGKIWGRSRLKATAYPGTGDGVVGSRWSRGTADGSNSWIKP